MSFVSGLCVSGRRVSRAEETAVIHRSEVVWPHD